MNEKESTRAPKSIYLMAKYEYREYLQKGICRRQKDYTPLIDSIPIYTPKFQAGHAGQNIPASNFLCATSIIE